MNTLANTNRVLDRYRPKEHTFLGILLFGAALLIGIIVGTGNWLYMIGPLALLAIFLWPVESALGGFAVLLPFDSMALTHGESGRTLVWFVGAATACVLLGTSLAGRRLRRLPAVAFCWMALIAWSLTTIIWAFDTPMALTKVPTALACL